MLSTLESAITGTI